MSHVMIHTLVTSLRYNGRRWWHSFGYSFNRHSSSCCKETSPTQSVMLGALLDAFQTTVWRIRSAVVGQSSHWSSDLGLQELLQNGQCRTRRITGTRTPSIAKKQTKLWKINIPRSFDFFARLYIQAGNNWNSTYCCGRCCRQSWTCSTRSILSKAAAGDFCRKYVRMPECRTLFRHSVDVVNSTK